MHPGLEGRYVGGAGRKLLAAMLRSAPWCWPTVRHPDAFDRAVLLAGCDGPPPVRAWSVGLVAVHASGPSLWRLCPEHEPPPPGVAVAQLSTVVRGCWSSASAALPRSLPVLWRSVEDARRCDLVAWHVASLPRPGQTAFVPSTLDDVSFGLPFVLALAARALDAHLPTDLIATGEVDEDGAVRQVEGIVDKIHILDERAPRIARVLLHPDDVDEFERSGRTTRLSLIPVRSGAEAIHVAIPAVDELVVRAGTDTNERSEIVESLFALALGHGGACVDWSPVRRAAAAAQRWNDSTPDEVEQLRFAEAVAARHQCNAGCLAVPAPGFLDRLPQPQRVDYVAHVVQQAADTGTPDVAAAEALAQRWLVRGGDAFPAHIRLLGALARLLAVAGRVTDAVALAREAATAWFARRRHADVAYPLEVWFRLAGALPSKSEYHAADALRTKVETVGELGSGGLYVDRARGRALVSLGQSGVARALLERVYGARNTKAHLRLSAARWLVRVHDEAGERDEAQALVRALCVAARRDGGDAAIARRYLALVALDRAVAQGARRAADRLVARLQAIEPTPTAVLLHHRPASGPDRAVYVQRLYPY